MDELPKDVIYYIGCLLDFEDLLVLSYVCKRLRRLVFQACFRDVNFASLPCDVFRLNLLYQDDASITWEINKAMVRKFLF